MDPITTAAVAVAILAAQKGAEKVGEEAGQASWAGLAKLIATIRARFTNDAEGEKALARVEHTPDDQQAQATLGLMLRVQMEHDAEFARRMEGIVLDAKESGELTEHVSIQADTIKAIFQEKVTVKGNFNIA